MNNQSSTGLGHANASRAKSPGQSDLINVFYSNNTFPTSVAAAPQNALAPVASSTADRHSSVVRGGREDPMLPASMGAAMADANVSFYYS